MRFVLDADGLIKLNLAGVLHHLVRRFHCVVPRAVYHEVVTTGRELRYKYVPAIEPSLADGAEISSSGEEPNPEVKLGPGEQEILRLLPRLPDAVVISDDRRFLNALSVAGTPSLAVAEVPGALFRWNILGRQEALEALEALKPVIRQSSYWDARAGVESMGGASHEQK